MTAPTIEQQLKQTYVGDTVDLFHIDLTPIGQSINFYFTPSSDRPINFLGKTYTPMPISINSGKDENLDTAPGRVVLSISNLTSMLAAMVISHGDLTGARVNVIRTFANYLDGAENGGTGQQFGTLRYIVFQKRMYNQQIIQWDLTTELDRPDVMLPLRQCLKSDVGANSVWCPGMQRTRL